MPRLYVLLGCLAAGAFALMLAARSHHDTFAMVGWAFATVLSLVMLVVPLVIMFLMQRVRPASRRGRHAER
jgi:heme exporter protein D